MSILEGLPQCPKTCSELQGETHLYNSRQAPQLQRDYHAGNRHLGVVLNCVGGAWPYSVLKCLIICGM